ncbi:MAG: 16S rRNA processing protein RimM [Deltaproteobacteria bacterium]|nr:16S rRNA processing protein RimM [Deltaproteobacteria bacterium]MCB9786766.1 16S rRNA processing protein RimM [Deltaproteobacteria bacterium]
MKLLLLGAVTKAQGLRGELGVLPFHEASPLWKVGSELVLVPPGVLSDEESRQSDTVEVAAGRTVRLQQVRPAGKGRLVIALAGVGDREAAEALRGGVLGVVPEALGEPDEDEYFYYEVPGWRVEDGAGELIGTIVRALPGQTELFEVRPASGGESFYIPVIRDIVTRIDRAGRRVVIEVVEGLLP